MGPPLFVYGTLQSGEERHGLVAGLARRPARTRGRLYHLPAGYPGLLLDGDGTVHGELLDPPDDRLLGLLDQVEGVDEGLFRRVLRPVSVGLRPYRAWVYELCTLPRGARLVADGRWRTRRWR